MKNYTDASLERILLNEYTRQEISKMSRTEREEIAREILDEQESARCADMNDLNMWEETFN